MPTLAHAQAIAERLVYLLAPACNCIDIAGSVRRRKPEPKDLEIVYLPIIDHIPVDLFGATAPHPRTDATIAQLVYDHILRLDDQVRRNGPKYKRLIYCATGMVVELFAATPQNYGLILALRTGPALFSRGCVTSECIGGAMPLGMVMRDGQLWRQGQQLDIPTEESFFAALNLPCWPPEQRTPERLYAHLDGRKSSGV